MATATSSAAPKSILSEIIVDHNNVKDLFCRYKDASSLDQKSTLVNTIIRELALHSEAEEATVYNSLQKFSEKDAEHLRHEHQELEESLKDVDLTKVDAPDFSQKFDHAIRLFIQHATEEETQPGQLAHLAKDLSPEDNAKLAADFIKYRGLVPTRPHPAAPQDGGVVHKLGGLMTKPMDKVVEMMQGRQFAELKFQHPANEGIESLKVDDKYLAKGYEMERVRAEMDKKKGQMPSV